MACFLSHCLIAKAEFEFPNELNLEDATQILESAAGKIYISVGTERGFWGFGMTPTTSTLILVDSQKDIAKYNKINIALVKIAKNLPDFLPDSPLRPLRHAF